MARHLRIQHGGDPAQGPPRDVANEPPAPRDVDGFPDTPDANRPGGGAGDLSGDQLDDMARRLGLAEGSDERSQSGDAGSVSRLDAVRERIDVTVGRSRHLLGGLLERAGDALRNAGRRLDRDG